MKARQMPSTPLEMWGGVECTVNRVRDRYFDQLELSGHSSRVTDIDRIASLGIKTVRYPLLWERTVNEHGEYDWRWADERMNALARAGIDPIVGLVHHGSGPRFTDLLDSFFPEKLAAYAGAVAERYPHLMRVTPVNEPLTTARFAALYGHWYPHHTDWRSFVKAIVNQCLATRAAIGAMREHIPEIQLVQTEDLGRMFSTPGISYQASFENERRWLTFDLLAGRVSERHPLWKHLALDDSLSSGLRSLARYPCPSDLVGINYYVTSDRFLDERLELYASDRAGGNGRDRYVDVEAVRVLGEGITGHAAILEEAWTRYKIPVAITEAHLGCTREHQLRWLMEAWDGALKAKTRGCDVRAVTAWALFGSFGWDSLVTREPLSYESGAFDVRSASPRETALATTIRSLSSRATANHPVCDEEGWWRSESRLSVLPYTLSIRAVRSPRSDNSCSVRRRMRPILITGARGTLGAAFSRICEERGLTARSLARTDLDISDSKSVRDAIRAIRPWAIINAAGYVRVDDAEQDRFACYRTNTVAVRILAEEAALAGIPLVAFSSDLVFDGSKRDPYVESDRVAPLGAYGASKAAAEVRALALHDKALVIRTSAFFGPWDQWNFAAIALRTLSSGLPFAAAKDSIVSPTYVPDLVNAALDLLIDGERGIWHLANPGALSWSDFADALASRAGLPSHLIRSVNTSELGLRARRPVYSALGSERGAILPSFENALDRWCEAIRIRQLTSSAA